MPNTFEILAIKLLELKFFIYNPPTDFIIMAYLNSHRKNQGSFSKDYNDDNSLKEFNLVLMNNGTSTKMN